MKTNAIATFATAMLLVGVAPSIAQQEAPLIRLTNQATAPKMQAGPGGIKPIGEKNLAGWLVLNGARFRNSEYPDLSKHLLETYAAEHQPNNSDAQFTQLPGGEGRSRPPWPDNKRLGDLPDESAVRRSDRRIGAVQFGRLVIVGCQVGSFPVFTKCNMSRATTFWAARD
jgi:hypothetical protein